MKKIMTLVVALACTATTFAQNSVGSFNITPMAGITLANMTNTNGDMKVGFIGGAEAQYQASDIFAVSAGLLYAQEGTKYDNGNLKTSYLNVPVLVNAYILPGFAVKLGIQPAFLLTADGEATAFGVTGSADVKDAMESFDLAMPIGVSYEYNNVVLDARYNLGLLKTNKHDLGDNNSMNSVFQVTLGYRF